jgi:hypothetical protein
MTGQIFGTDIFQCPYANVAGAQVNFHLLTGYFELSAGGMQNTRKSFWNSDKNVSAAKAPNCVAISGKDRADKFRQVCAFHHAKSFGWGGCGRGCVWLSGATRKAAGCWRDLCRRIQFQESGNSVSDLISGRKWQLCVRRTAGCLAFGEALRSLSHSSEAPEELKKTALARLAKNGE